jgi:hypothetical protein
VAPAKAATIGQILAMFGKADATLAASASKIRFRTEDEANIQDVGSAGYAAYCWPLAPSPDSRINVTRHFLERSELNRVSSPIHEAMHVNDPDSGTATNHVPEWYVTAPMAAALGLTFQGDRPDFATRYDPDDHGGRASQSGGLRHLRPARRLPGRQPRTPIEAAAFVDGGPVPGVRRGSSQRCQPRS